MRLRFCLKCSRNLSRYNVLFTRIFEATTWHWNSWFRNFLDWMWLGYHRMGCVSSSPVEDDRVDCIGTWCSRMLELLFSCYHSNISSPENHSNTNARTQVRADVGYKFVLFTQVVLAALKGSRALSNYNKLRSESGRIYELVQVLNRISKRNENPDTFRKGDSIEFRTWTSKHRQEIFSSSPCLLTWEPRVHFYSRVTTVLESQVSFEPWQDSGRSIKVRS